MLRFEDTSLARPECALLPKRQEGDSGRYSGRGVQVGMTLLVFAVMLSLGRSGPQQTPPLYADGLAAIAWIAYRAIEAR